MQKIIQDVLDLPADKRDDLAALLKRTTLSALINASKVVADRLDFLRGLDILLFDPQSKEQLLERSQLHKILEDHTWIFGEEFALSVSDRSLEDVLQKTPSPSRAHRRTRRGCAPRRWHGRIVDLMLSRLIPQSRADEREHLIVELKRPKKVIVRRLCQIESYAMAVAADERFRDTKTRWIFWAVSDDIAPNIRVRARQPEQARGVGFGGPTDAHLTVWVKSWGQALESCRGRLEFFQRNLEYVADDESAIALLRKLYSKYLPSAISGADSVASEPSVKFSRTLRRGRRVRIQPAPCAQHREI